MKIAERYIIYCGLVILAFISYSCKGGFGKNYSKELVISELMASNRTGLMNHKGKTHDWIEIKNTSNDTINLEEYQLEVVSADSLSNEKEEEEKTWEFPEVKIGGGETMIVFAHKSKKKKEEKEEGEEKEEKEKWNPASGKSLKAELNLPKNGGIIRLLTPGGDVVSEVRYGKLSADRSLALQPDGQYKPTYWQSPGYENTRQGYEAAMEKMEDQRNSPLLIWELTSREKDEHKNWVELKNVGDRDIDLAEYGISKKGKNRIWNLPPRTLKPGELITIQLAGKDKNPGNPLQAPFKLGSSETLSLWRNGKFVDGVCARLSPIGGSVGRMNGKKGFFFFSSSTRNAENGEEGKRFITAKPEFDKAPGVYANEDKIVLRLKNKNQTVHYTTNGSAPTSSSPVIEDSLVVDKKGVIRTFAEGDSVSLKSDIVTSSYILGPEHDIAVMNIVVNNGDLFDFNHGIYANGPDYGEEWPHKGANFWKDWTKNAHVEFFDNREGKEGFSLNCGLKIFGGFSRNEDKKSFRLKFRGGYGNSDLTYDFFGTGQEMELEDLVLRSGSQDWKRCMVRDEFFTSLMKAQSPAILTQEYRPVALYINGSYFGLYYLREKIDNNFVERKLNLPSNDDINIIMSKGYNEEGSATDYKKLIQYVSGHDMTVPENYAYMKKNVDLVGLIDYKLGEIYSGNSDVGNVRYVRSMHPESDKKWHFVFYDLDATWVGYKPSAAYYLSLDGGAAESNVTHHNIMINKLLKNKEFRALFLERLSHHLHNTFTPKNANAVFDALVEKIRPEMKLNCERWPQLSYNQWEKNVAEFKKKFDDKPKVMLKDIRAYLKVTDDENKKYFGDLGY